MNIQWINFSDKLNMGVRVKTRTPDTALNKFLKALLLGLPSQSSAKWGGYLKLIKTIIVMWFIYWKW